MASPPDIIRFSPRSSDHNDCAIAAIEIACGVTYEKALEACLVCAPNPLQGMKLTHIRAALKFLGFKVRVTKKFDVEEDTGILWVDDKPERKGNAHVVYLWEGRIVEPEGFLRQLWLSPEQFLKHHGYVAEGLITVEEQQ